MDQNYSVACNGFVFPSKTGGPLNEASLIRLDFRPILKKAGLPATLRLHDLRHSMATLLLSAGEQAKVVQERLGHSTVAFTLDVYAATTPGMQRAAADKLEALLYGRK